MAEQSQALFQLEAIQAQLARDNTTLHAASKFTVAHLNFNTFKSTWPLASAFPHVQIGMRDGEAVYAFPTRDRICTVASSATPILTTLTQSIETLEDVDLVVPFDCVDEWKSELSGSLSREFRALLKYLFLLHAADGGSGKNLGMPVKVEDLKMALMMLRQARQRQEISATPSGSAGNSKTAYTLQEQTNKSYLLGQETITPENFALESLLTEQAAVTRVDKPATEPAKILGQEVYQCSTPEPPLPSRVATVTPTFRDVSDTTRSMSIIDGFGGAPDSDVSSMELLPSTQLEPHASEKTEFKARKTIAMIKNHHNDDSNALTKAASGRTLDRLILEGNIRTKATTSGSDPRGPVMGFFTVGLPARPSLKQTVTVTHDASGCESTYFAASNHNHESKYPNGRRAKSVAKAFKFATEKAGNHPDTPISDDESLMFDDDTDVEIIDDYEPDRDMRQSFSAASNKLFHTNTRSLPIVQNVNDTIGPETGGRIAQRRTGLKDNAHSMAMAHTVRNAIHPASRLLPDQNSHIGMCPIDQIATNLLQATAASKIGAEWPGRKPLAQRLVVARAAPSMERRPVLINGQDSINLSDHHLRTLAAGEDCFSNDEIHNMNHATCELERPASVGRAMVPTQVEAITQVQQVQLQPAPVQATARISAPPSAVPLQMAAPAGIESIAALHRILGTEGLRLVHHNHAFTLQMRLDWPPNVVPLGVMVGVLRQNANVAIMFHVILPHHPAASAAMIWYAFDRERNVPVPWSPPDRVHEGLLAEIVLDPIFHLWKKKEDFLALLCLVVIGGSHQWLGGPYIHRIPIAQYCRGRLIDICRALASAIPNNGELQEGRSLQGRHLTARQEQIKDIQPQPQQSQAAQTLLSLARRTEVPSTQGPGDQMAAIDLTSPTETESFAALQCAIGKETLAVLLQPDVSVIFHQSSDQAFIPVGVHVGNLTNNVQKPRQVIAFVASGSGTAYLAPMMLLTCNEKRSSWLELAKHASVEAIMPAIAWVPAFRVVDTVEDLLALVSLAILKAAAINRTGVVEHKIPIVPWCRGHLAMLVKRFCMKKPVPDSLKPLKRNQEQMAKEAGEINNNHAKHVAKRARMVPPQVETENDSVVDTAAASVSQASSLSLNYVLTRSIQVANASMRHAEQLFVWHTQNVAAQKAMMNLSRRGGADTQQYRSLETAISAREIQIQTCLVSGVFVNNELSHQLNNWFSTLLNQT